jgi:hypothetical protein
MKRVKSHEMFDDTKRVIRSHKSKKDRKSDNAMAKRRRTDNAMAKRRRTDNAMAKRRRIKLQTIVDKILHRK